MRIDTSLRGRCFLAVALVLALAVAGPNFLNASLAGEVAPGGPQSAPKADDAGKQAANQQPAPDPFVARAGAVRDFISGTIGSWAIVILVALLLFYRPIKDLLAALTNSMRDRGVTLDISTFVKLQLSEPPLDLPDDRVTLRSPQELELELPEDRPSVLSDIAPQLEFQISDRVARYYAENGHEAEARAMLQALDAVALACRTAGSLDAVTTQLRTYATRLEATRFLQAASFHDLLEQYLFLANGIQALEPQNPSADFEAFLVLHCAGAAYAQKDQWPKAKSLLDKIVRRNDQPLYPPAGDLWLACAYHEELAKVSSRTNLNVDSPEFADPMRKLIDKGRQLLHDMETWDWTAVPFAPRQSGYYKRELLKTLGTISSILAEHSKVPDEKIRQFKYAEETLTKCAEAAGIDGELPSPLDHNNLADLYRQIGDWSDAIEVRRRYYAQGHEKVTFAIKQSREPDPIFYNTRAMIFAREQQPLKGLLTLQEYSEADAARGSWHDMEQYADNQRLAALLVGVLDVDSKKIYLPLATRILDDASRFVEAQAHKIPENPRRRLRADIQELLGETHLKIPGNESLAVAAFDRLFALDTLQNEDLWRCRLKRATALTRLACAERRNFSSQVAAQHRRRADIDLDDVLVAINHFSLDSGTLLQRKRYCVLRLDTVATIHALAEENFAEGESEKALSLIEQETAVLLSIRAALLDQGLQKSFGVDLAKTYAQITSYEKYRGFLLGRIAIRSDPLLEDEELIRKVENNFRAARGMNETLECRIDLEFGQLLLTAALAGKGNVRSLYEQSLSSLEAASLRNAPALRAEVLRALAEGYARRGAVARKAREVKQKP